MKANICVLESSVQLLISQERASVLVHWNLMELFLSPVFTLLFYFEIQDHSVLCNNPGSNQVFSQMRIYHFECCSFFFSFFFPKLESNNVQYSTEM